MELHPVHPTLLLDHRRAMVLQSSGPRANPLYRDTWARLDTCWALVDQLQDCPALSLEEQQRARDLALAAATTAAQAQLNGVVDEAPVLSWVRDAARTVTGPNLELREGPEGPRVRLNRPPPTFTDLEQGGVAALPVGRPPRAPPPATVRLGTGTTVRSADDEVAGANTWLAWSAWLQSAAWGVDALRLSVDLATFDPGAARRGDLSLAWTLSAREQLVPGWTLTLEARSLPQSWEPRLLRGGLAWAPLGSRPEWVLRVGASQGFAPGGVPLDRRLELRVQWNGPWDTPADPDGWPLGEDLHATAPSWPAHPGWGPNVLAPAGVPADPAQAARLGVAPVTLPADD